MLKTSHRTAHSHAFHIRDSDHTHSLTSTWDARAMEAEKSALNTGIRGYQRMR